MKKHQWYLVVAVIVLAVFVIAAYVVTQTSAVTQTDSGCPSGCCTSNSQVSIEPESLLSLAKINNT